MKQVLGIGLAIFLGIAAGLLCWWYFETPLKVAYLVGIVILLVTLWTNESLPLGVVSLLPIILFPTFGILDTKTTTANYANPIIYLFLGGFMIATATEKIGLHQVIAKEFLAFFPKTPKGVIASLGVASVALGMALSNSTVALLLLPVALSISSDPFLRVRFLLSVAFGSSISGITMPIGSPPNLIFLGFLQSVGLESISFTTWIFMMSPLTILMLWLMIWLLSRNTGEHSLDTDIFSHITITKEHKRLLMLMGLLLIILLANSPIKPFYDGLGLNENVVLLAFGILMFVPKLGFLTWADSKSIPYEIIFLFGAGFCIAMAFTQMKLGESFTHIFELFAPLPFVILALVVCLFIVMIGVFLSNTALIAILLPIIFESTRAFLSPEYQVLLMLVATICVSFTFVFPISTPPNAVVYSRGEIKLWDMVRYGFILSLGGVILVTIFSLVYWRGFLMD